MPRRTRTNELLTPGRSIITLDPNTWPRSYQKPLLYAITKGTHDRLMAVWHRGAGKDYVSLFATILRMLERPGAYYHIWPEAAQARRFLWDGIDEQGHAFLDLFPPELIAEKNETEMMIRLKPTGGHTTGAIWQLLGADDPNRHKGMNPAGCIFSEYQLIDPLMFQKVAEPRLRTNRGWAVFILTPQGENHAYQLWQSARAQPERWWTELLTVEETRKDAPGEDGSRLITEEAIAQERRDGKPEELIQQEYYCSWGGSLVGAILAAVLARARTDGRITEVPWEVNLPVKTAWDLGKGDGTAIWFYQVAHGPGGRMYRFIDYWFGRGKDMAECCRAIKEEKPYFYNDHVGPWDLDHDFGMGTTRKDIATGLGVHFRVAPRMLLEDAIDAARTVFSRCVFDERKCGAPQKDGPSGLAGLGGWRFAWDKEKQSFSTLPIHDANSHPGDAFRTFAVAPCDHNDDTDALPKDRYARMQYNPLLSLSQQRDPRRYAEAGRI